MESEEAEQDHYQSLKEAVLALKTPGERGKVVAIVQSAVEDERNVLPVGQLIEGQGLEGDRRAQYPGRNVSLAQYDVLRTLSQNAPLSLSGSNLIVDLDLSRANLPPGARLRIGEALCQVSETLNDACGKFHARYGETAYRLTRDEDFPDHRLRGLFVKVLRGGAVRPGNTIEVCRTED